MNVRSIMNKYKKITEHLFDANADIMFLCETWINPDCQYIFPYLKKLALNYAISHEILMIKLEVVLLVFL